MAEKDLHLYIYLVSQPSRALVIFCKLNNIDAEIHSVSMAKGEHKSKEFKAINPMGQLPAIVDKGFKLFESHAILRYLATTKPGVPDHWFPADPLKRARIDNILDWHHSNLRRGASLFVFHSALAPKFGVPQDENEIMNSEKILKSSLKIMEEVFIEGDAPFLGGASEPSIADLSLACELKQLEFLGTQKKTELLGPFEKVRKWLSEVENALSPHFTEVHSQMGKF